MAGVAAYLGLAILANLSAWVHGPSRVLPASPYPDVQQFSWFLAATAHALASGHNPFVTNWINYPAGANMVANTSIIAPAVLLAPVTLAFGPVVAFNVALVLSFAGSATAAFLVFRRYTRWAPAAWIGGLLYGFSPYLVAQGSLGHLHLTLVAVPPLVLLALDELLVRQRGRLAAWGIALGALLAVQLLTSAEVLAEMGVLTVVGLAVLAAAHPGAVRVHLRRARAPLGLAAATFVVLGGYPLWLAVAGPQHVSGAIHPGLSSMGTDLGALVVPTSLDRVAPGSLASIGDGLGPGVEHGAYLGLALIALVVLLVVRFRDRGTVRFAAVMGAVALILSLGPRLALDDHPSGVPLPFALVDKLPLMDDLAPERFALFVALFAAMVVAVGLGELRAAPRSAMTWATVALLAVTVASLVPAWPEATSRVDVPTFFTSSLVRRIPVGSVALVYPIANDAQDDSMVWQAESGLRFKMLDGYVLVPGPGGVGEVPWLNSLTDVLLEECRVGARLPALTPHLVSRVRAELAADDVSTVIVGPVGASPGSARRLMTTVLGRPPAEVGGVAVWWHVVGGRAG